MSPKAKQFALAGLAASVPVILAILLAFLQSFRDQQNRALILATEAEKRVATTSDQLWAGFQALTDIAPHQACSPDSIMQMRRTALGSPYLAGLGFISN